MWPWTRTSRGNVARTREQRPPHGHVANGCRRHVPRAKHLHLCLRIRRGGGERRLEASHLVSQLAASGLFANGQPGLSSRRFVCTIQSAHRSLFSRLHHYGTYLSYLMGRGPSVTVGGAGKFDGVCSVESKTNAAFGGVLAFCRSQWMNASVLYWDARAGRRGCPRLAASGCIEFSRAHQFLSSTARRALSLSLAVRPLARSLPRLSRLTVLFLFLSLSRSRSARRRLGSSASTGPAMGPVFVSRSRRLRLVSTRSTSAASVGSTA